MSEQTASQAGAALVKHRKTNAGGRPKGTGKPLAEATRRRMSAGQTKRRAREAAERIEAERYGKDV